MDQFDRRRFGVLVGAIVALTNVSAVFEVKASEPSIERVVVAPEPTGTFDVAVTVRHADTGWDHDADRWQVMGADGTVHGTRTLLHSHVDEQPFTRNQSAIAIASGVRSVIVRAGDNPGALGQAKKIDLPGR